MEGLMKPTARTPAARARKRSQGLTSRPVAARSLERRVCWFRMLIHNQFSKSAGTVGGLLTSPYISDERVAGLKRQYTICSLDHIRAAGSSLPAEDERYEHAKSYCPAAHRLPAEAQCRLLRGLPG